jgi:hypothetical protein
VGTAPRRRCGPQHPLKPAPTGVKRLVQQRPAAAVAEHIEQHEVRGSGRLLTVEAALGGDPPLKEFTVRGIPATCVRPKLGIRLLAVSDIAALEIAESPLSAFPIYPPRASTSDRAAQVS